MINLIRQCMLIVMVTLLASCATLDSTGPDDDIRPEFDNVARNPQASVYNVALGMSFLEKGQLNLAQSKLRKALGQDPKSSQANWSYALLLIELDKKDLAEKYFKRAIDSNKNDSEALNNYGTYLCDRGEIEQALTFFEKAAANKLYSTPEYALTNAGICASNNGEYETAEGYLKKAVALNQEYPNALYHMSYVRYELGNYRGSRAFRERLESLIPDDPKVYWLCAITEVELGNRQESLECATILRSKYPASEEAAKLLQ